jgi:penicillin-binding protein 2
MTPNSHIDWNRLYADEHPAVEAVEPRRRLWVCLIGFGLLLGMVLTRAAWIEATEGAAFRAEAARPLLRHRSLPAARGRIVARDGAVLAHDQNIRVLAVRYRYLDEPPNPAWLRSMARSRLTRAERKETARVAAEEAAVLGERRELAARLATLCGVTPAEWNARAARVQARVERIAEEVNRRRQESFEERRAEASRPAPSLLDRWLGPVEEPPPGWTIVREELDAHAMVEDVSATVAAEITGHTERYPGVSIIERSRRDYPAGTLAAHVLGHLGTVTEEELAADADEVWQRGDRRGRTGLELQYEELLRGRRGEIVETTDRGGRVLAIDRQRGPRAGRDLVLTLDSRLQATAESLLDEGLRRRKLTQAQPENVGGAIIVMDIHAGTMLAAASSPRFNPNSFSGDDSAEINTLLSDPGNPLFDRVGRMAIPPGSVFKTLTAVALLQDGKLDPDESFHCQGYLKTPDQLRCEIFAQRGVGHGDVTLTAAIAQSCNVYFFHHATALGAAPLTDWACRFGFGGTTGIDLPGEAAGNVPRPDASDAAGDHRWRTVDTQMLAIGQGELTATPLQIARMMAAVANGGKLVTPRVVEKLGPNVATEDKPAADSGKEPSDQINTPPPRAIDGLDASTLAAVRRGLEQTVASPQGTAHTTAFLDQIAIAGKTGTAETGGGLAAHAWFAGYVPTESPKFAFVVVLEHSGDGGETAGPLVRRLVLRMRELGSL